MGHALVATSLKRFASIVIVFLIVFGLGLALIELLLQTGAMLAIGESVAAQTSAVADLFGIEHQLSGLSIITETRNLIIVVECTAIFVMVVFVALVVAYPFEIKLKILALIGGLIIIHFVNIIRLVLAVMMADKLGDVGFNFMHNFFFQALMVMVLLLMWGVLLSIDRTGTVPKEVLSYFGLVLIALFVFEGAFVFLSRAYPSVFPLTETAYLAPALAVIVCARGITPLRRALLAVGGSAAFFGAYKFFYQVDSQLRMGQIAATPQMELAMEIGYVLIILGIPSILILLAAGANPRRLWLKK